MLIGTQWQKGVKAVQLQLQEMSEIPRKLSSQGMSRLPAQQQVGNDCVKLAQA